MHQDKTLAEKILSQKTGGEVYAGDYVTAPIDYIVAHDGTAPLAIKWFREMGASHVWDPSRIILVIDHASPSPAEGNSELHKMMRSFALQNSIYNFYDVGYGICHQIMIEEGFAYPFRLIVGADSHTCSYGAVSSFATGIGSTEAAYVWATGELWFKVPRTMRVFLEGNIPQGVYSKDIFLHLAREIGVSGATYMALEYVGEAIKELSTDARITLSNMAIEVGGKTGLFYPDEETDRFLKSIGKDPFPKIMPDGSPDKTLEIDMSSLVPLVAMPHNVDNVKPASELSNIKIDQAFIGSCTNGRLEDLRIAASILKGKKVAKNVRLIVIPASRKIFRRAISEGLIDIFLEAGASVYSSTCGPCVGAHLGILGEGEKCISTSNRNFQGRMGSRNSEIYLASPATVAASAVNGYISDPREVR